MDNPVAIQKIVAGDYVKYNNELHEIASIYGVNKDGTLAKPSQGGFGVITVDQLNITMWEAQSYHKSEDINLED